MASEVHRQRQAEMYRGVRKKGEGRVYNLPTPPEVLADLERRRALRPRDLTAVLLGDPLPGRSALDRGRNAAPSIIHDPLDDLMFGH